VYREQTEKLIEHYRKAGLLLEIDGTQPAMEVAESLAAALKERLG
jgi:adenylate kinase family enzyme